jgi:hypothetical protein
LERRKELRTVEMLKGKDDKYYPRERPRLSPMKRFMISVAVAAERDRERQREEQVHPPTEEADKEYIPLKMVHAPTEEDRKQPRTFTVVHPATALRGSPIGEKMRELDAVVGGYEDKIKSEAGPDAVAEAVVEVLSEWIESFVSLVEAKLGDEGINPPPA